MLSVNVRALSEMASNRLNEVIELLEPFLNKYCLSQLAEDDGTDEAVAYYSGLLSDLRHLLVFSEVCSEKLWVLHRRQQATDELAAKTLYEVYQQCINVFFYPKNECYTEDGRYAYTGQDAIRFRYKPNPAVRALILDLAKIFEELRDELAFYENDYMTQKRMQAQK